MVVFDINLNAKGYGTIPKEIRDMWGRRLSLIPNNTAGVIYRKGEDLEDVKASLKILLSDVEHRIDQGKRKKKNNFAEGSEDIEG